MIEKTMTDDAPKWVLWVERQWGALLRVIHFIVTSTADSAVDIAARSMAIAAPLPNAISVYNISQKELNFGPVAALAFALVIELIGFALVEYSLFLFDGWLQSPRKWLFPFAASVTVVVVGISIVIRFVYTIELAGNGHTIMAWLPVISLCAFVSIGLKRWHDRQPEMSSKSIKSSVKHTVKQSIKSLQPPVKSDLTPRQAELLKLLSNLDGKPAEAVNKSELARQLKVSRPTLNKEFDILQSSGKVALNGHVEVSKQA